MNNKNDMTLLSSDELKRIVQLLWLPNESGEEPIVYAILDGARDKRIEAFHRQGQLKSSCLYEGELSYSMAIAAPYIMRLEKDHPQTNQIIQQGWGNSWGIFAISWPPATLIKVRHNCRKIARVKGPDGKNLIFRYYDPRVLRNYLPNCDQQEADKVFGHVTDFVVEGENEGVIHRFCRTENGVIDVNELDESSADVVKLMPGHLDNRSELKITDAQFESFEAVRFKRFLADMETHLLTHFSEQIQSMPVTVGFSDWVKNNVERAMNAELTSRQEVCRYLNVAMTHGEDFYQQDWADKILSSEYYPSTKASLLENESLAQIKQQKESLQEEIDAQEKTILKQFYQAQQAKVGSIGRALFNLKFDNTEKEKDWIYRVGEHCLAHNLNNDMELDLWLDLSMRYGEFFYQEEWAKIEGELVPQEQLQYFLSHQPHLAETRLKSV